MFRFKLPQSRPGWRVIVEQIETIAAGPCPRPIPVRVNANRGDCRQMPIRRPHMRL